MLDIETKIGILPIQLTYEPNGYILTAKRPSGTKLFEDDDMSILQENKPFTVTLDKNDVNAEVNKVIPRKDMPEGPGEGTSSDDEESPNQQKGKSTKQPKKSSVVDEYTDRIQKAGWAEMSDIESDIAILKQEGNITDEEYQKLILEVDSRKSDLIFEEPDLGQIIKVGDKLIAKEIEGSLFDGAAEVIVTKLDSKKKIAYLRSTESKTAKEVAVPLDKLNEYFMQSFDLNETGDVDQEFEDTGLTSEEETLLNINQDNVGDFLSDPNLKAKAVADGESMTEEDAQNNIDDILNC